MPLALFEGMCVTGIHWDECVHTIWLRVGRIVALVVLLAAGLSPGTSSGEPDRHVAAIREHPGRPTTRARPELTPHPDRTGLIWPVQGPVTSRFGPRGLWGWHRGVDIKAPRGAPIRAAATGTVVFSGRQSSYGQVIKIAHANGLTTIYAHNSANFVKAGTRVRTGTLIGAVGRTGRATSNHLHFEVRRQGVANNPLPLLRRPDPHLAVATHDGASRGDTSAHDPRS